MEMEHGPLLVRKRESVANIVHPYFSKSKSPDPPLIVRAVFRIRRQSSARFLLSPYYEYSQSPIAFSILCALLIE